jgi:hypothetical protein
MAAIGLAFSFLTGYWFTFIPVIVLGLAATVVAVIGSRKASAQATEWETREVVSFTSADVPKLRGLVTMFTAIATAGALATLIGMAVVIAHHESLAGFVLATAGLLAVSLGLGVRRAGKRLIASATER